MPVIAIVNRKGGSGKSTLAVNIAAWCAHNGWKIMLGDVDRQRSVRSWLSRRPASAPPITSWMVDRSRVLRPPHGTTHVLLDTPGALYDHDLAKLVVNVDALVVPIGPSLFDQEASLSFMEELRRLPRVSSGRCHLVAVGMRWPAEKRQRWLDQNRQWHIPLLAVIPESPVYRSCLDEGVSIFDLPEEAASAHIEPWRPLLDWLRAEWSQGFQAQQAAAAPARAPLASAPLTSAPLAGLQPAPTLLAPQPVARLAEPQMLASPGKPSDPPVEIDHPAPAVTARDTPTRAKQPAPEALAPSPPPRARQTASVVLSLARAAQRPWWRAWLGFR